MVGDPLEPETTVGPLANEQGVDEIERQVNASVQMGATVILGGQRGSSDGYYYLPTIITGCQPGMPVYDEETFGPVYAVIAVQDMAEAITVANSSPYGLGSTLFTSDVNKAQKEIIPHIESGAVFINGPMKSDPRLPFGGVKKSGYGRELASFGIREFINIKTVWIK